MDFTKICWIISSLNFSELKVRLGEYDTEGFRPPERFVHTEIAVESVVIHPEVNIEIL